MYRHIVLFNSSDKALVKQCCEAVITSLKIIEGLLKAEYAENENHYAQGYDQIAMMEFVSQAALQKWSEHPIHIAMMNKLNSTTQIISFDYKCAN